MTVRRYVPREGTIPTLPVPDPEGWRRLHLVGIGGAGMRGIARLLLARGVEVCGSDLKDSRGLEALRAAGATVHVGHRADHLGHPDAVVISSAVAPGNPEVRAARERGIPVLMRAQVLAALMRGRRGVAVAGTHGKTTTTSMVSVILSRAGRSPSYVIGGDLNEIGSGAEHGSGDAFVAEADESDGSFLLLSPEVGVVTAVEEDHLDFYTGGRPEIEGAFRAFAERCGVVVACWDDAGVRAALEGVTVPVRRYGTEEGVDGRKLDLRVSHVEVGGGGARAVIEVEGSSIEVHLPLPVRHNLLNACAAIEATRLLGVPPAVAAEALGTFSGARRRFELRGHAGGAAFVDDYAHHPTEVRATIEAARAAGGRIVAVFQPHRYTRTQAMWREFGQSLAGADVAVLTEVYGAGEQPIPGVSGKLVVEALAEAAPGKRVVYLPRRSEVGAVLAGLVRAGDLVLTMGAGDITMVAGEALERLRAGTSGTAPRAGGDGR